MTNDIGLYDSHYSQLAADPQSEVRHETYGEDLGQASWLTLEELRVDVWELDVRNIVRPEH